MWLVNNKKWLFFRRSIFSWKISRYLPFSQKWPCLPYGHKQMYPLLVKGIQVPPKRHGLLSHTDISQVFPKYLQNKTISTLHELLVNRPIAIPVFAVTLPGIVHRRTRGTVLAGTRQARQRWTFRYFQTILSVFVDVDFLARYLKIMLWRILSRQKPYSLSNWSYTQQNHQLTQYLQKIRGELHPSATKPMALKTDLT